MTTTYYLIDTACCVTICEGLTFAEVVHLRDCSHERGGDDFINESIPADVLRVMAEEDFGPRVLPLVMQEDLAWFRRNRESKILRDVTRLETKAESVCEGHSGGNPGCPCIEYRGLAAEAREMLR